MNREEPDTTAFRLSIERSLQGERSCASVYSECTLCLLRVLATRLYLEREFDKSIAIIQKCIDQLNMLHLFHLAVHCSAFQLKAEVASPDDCSLVCPLSGYCFPKNNTVNEEVSFVSCFWRVVSDRNWNLRCKMMHLQAMIGSPPQLRLAANALCHRHLLRHLDCLTSKDPELSVAQQVGRWFEQGSVVMSQASFTSWKPRAYGAHAGFNRILHE